MSDVLVLTVPLRFGMGYPTANDSGSAFRGGKKSPAYKALAYDVEEAAKAAMGDGWVPIAYPCRAIITYYRPDRIVVDALNLGSCEANALTRAGVWTDDELAREPILSYQPGDPGEPRVVIVVQRLAPPIGAVARVARPRGPKLPEPPHVVQTRPGAVSGPVPTLNGKPITMQDALALIGREGDKKR